MKSFVFTSVLQVVFLTSSLAHAQESKLFRDHQIVSTNASSGLFRVEEDGTFEMRDTDTQILLLESLGALSKLRSPRQVMTKINDEGRLPGQISSYFVDRKRMGEELKKEFAWNGHPFGSNLLADTGSDITIETFMPWSKRALSFELGQDGTYDVQAERYQDPSNQKYKEEITGSWSQASGDRAFGQFSLAIIDANGAREANDFLHDRFPIDYNFNRFGWDRMVHSENTKKSVATAIDLPGVHRIQDGDVEASRGLFELKKGEAESVSYGDSAQIGFPESLKGASLDSEVDIVLARGFISHEMPQIVAAWRTTLGSLQKSDYVILASGIASRESLLGKLPGVLIGLRLNQRRETAVKLGRSQQPGYTPAEADFTLNNNQR